MGVLSLPPPPQDARTMVASAAANFSDFFIWLMDESWTNPIWGKSVDYREIAL